MKACRSLLVLLLLLGVCSLADARPSDEATGAKTVVLRVEGMTCGGCASQVQAALEKLGGVTQALVSYAKGEAVVTFDPAKLTDEQVLEAVTATGYKAQVAAACGSEPDSLARHGATSSDGGQGRLTQEQLAKVVSHVVQQVMGPEPFEPDREKIEAATGVEIPDNELMRVQAAVVAKLSETAEGRAKLDGNSRCADYGACSMHGNLEGATGKELETYVREKGEDGRTYEGLALPEFTAQGLDGKPVRSADLKGKPALLVVMTGFCNHSIQSLPILREVVRSWGPRGVRVVGVFANSGPPGDLGQWLPDFRPEFEVWVKADANFGDVIDSHMVPTYLYVDAAGQVRKKFVGYHTAAEVQEPLAALVEATAPSAGSQVTDGR